MGNDFDGHLHPLEYGLRLCAAASRGSLQTHLNELALLIDKDCRGCCRNCCSGMFRGTFDNIRGLAVAAITFGFLELLIYVVTFSLLGWSFTYFGNYNSYYSNYYNVQNTRVFSCYAGSNRYCTISYYPTFLYQSYSIPCFSYGNSYCYVTLPDTIYPNNYYYPYF